MVSKVVHVNECDLCGGEAQSSEGTFPKGWSSLTLRVHPSKRGRPTEKLACNSCTEKLVSDRKISIEYNEPVEEVPQDQEELPVGDPEPVSV